MKMMWIHLLLMFLPGDEAAWGVTYGPQCEVRGSTSVIRCSFQYPFIQIVTSVTWSKGRRGGKALSLENRLKYDGDKSGNCDLRIQNVAFTDAGRYYFRFKTVLSGWTTRDFAELTVTELRAVVRPSTASEGEGVSLTCESGCPESSSTVWFKDGEPFQSLDFRASRASSGKYRCALFGQQEATSAPVHLNILYAPLDVVLTMSPSHDLVSGGSVTLGCSSDANPPVRPGGYSMFKDDVLIRSGQKLTFPVLEPGHSGRYRCRAWNNISREGDAFMASEDVELDVKFAPVNTSFSAFDVEGKGVNLTCTSDANPPANHYTWYQQLPDSPGLLQVGSGQVLSLASVKAYTGQYLCRAQNLLGQQNSSLMPVTRSSRTTGNVLVLILAGVGVGLLSITVLLFWYKQRSQKKNSCRDAEVKSTRGNAAVDDDLNNVYANVARPRRKSRPQDSLEDDVIYTSVHIKPRTSGNIRQDPTPFNTSEEGSVIYSTLEKRNL